MEEHPVTLDETSILVSALLLERPLEIFKITRRAWDELEIDTFQVVKIFDRIKDVYIFKLEKQ